MSGPGHGPFGEKGFHGALIGCGVLVAVGSLMLLVGGQAVSSVGASLLVLGVLGLATGAVGLLAERHLQRRRPAVRLGLHRRNGHRARPPDPSRLKDLFGDRR
jgi:predicted lysophospholipase L1 biosynthesis ABC-type transport system permease subunit